MPGPSRAGLFVYAIDFHRMASFYESLLALTRLHERDDMIVLEGDGLQLVVHAIPPHIAAEIEITSPPERRSETALKFFFTVPSLADAKRRAQSLGGSIDDEVWEASSFRVSNGVDPEGNVFQIREFFGA